MEKKESWKISKVRIYRKNDMNSKFYDLLKRNSSLCNEKDTSTFLSFYGIIALFNLEIFLVKKRRHHRFSVMLSFSFKLVHSITKKATNVIDLNLILFRKLQTSELIFLRFFNSLFMIAQFFVG